MFQDAAKLYWKARCFVGGGSPSIPGKIHGGGCQIADDLVVSALHVWTEISHQYDYPVAGISSGLHRCEIIFQSDSHDVMLLRAVEKINDNSLYDSVEYPKFCNDYPTVGMSVGFVSRLELYETIDNRRGHTFLGNGEVCMNIKSLDDEVHNFAISATVMQKGFSGSPVFRPDGTLIGVLIQTVRFRAEIEDLSAPVYQLPVFGSILPIRNFLAKVNKAE